METFSVIIIVIVAAIALAWLTNNKMPIGTPDSNPSETEKEGGVQRISAGPILIIDKEDEFPKGKPFRLSSDGEHVIRYKHKCPTGCHYVAFSEVEVAGISRPEYSDAVLLFFTNSNRSLRLRWEPSNKHDTNAIEVIGQWGVGYSSGKIGYVPRDIAKELAPMIDRGEAVVATIKTMFLHRLGYSPGLRMHIWM